MDPIRTPDMTDTMVGPEGSEILPLPVRVEDGMTASVWELDAEDKRKLAEGGRIGLVVFAHPTPPVAMSIVGPHCEGDPAPMVWSDRLKIYVHPKQDDSEGGGGRSQIGG